MNGIQAFLELLTAHGESLLFGNPGTTELPLNEALATDSRFRYIFGIHEIPVVSMAEGYAQASGRVGIINLHTACGLGNGLGMIFNAHIAGTPLIVTAGQQDARLRFGEPVLEGDLVNAARTWTKWSYEVHRVEDLPSAFRRAWQVATTPPTGPVFLSLPLDVQAADAAHLDLRASHPIDRQVRPSSAALDSAAALLAGAKNPVILAGSRITAVNGCAELQRLAEHCAAPVFAECSTSHGRLPMAPGHALYQGPLPVWSPDVLAKLQPYDVALVVGMNLLRLYIHREPEHPLPPHLRLIHLDCNPWEIGKNFPVDVALWGDPAEGMRELRDRLPKRANHDTLMNAFAVQRQQRIDEIYAQAEQEADIRPMTPRVMITALARVLPADVAIVDEAPTTHQQMLERLGAIADPSGYFAHRGWALGWGIGTAVGVKLAWPDRPVIALIGDGSAMYGIQALWSAAHHRIPIIVIICNNANYQILKNCGALMGLEQVAAGRAPGMAVVDPAPDFVGLARSLGVEAKSIREPDELTAAVRDGIAQPRPLLLNVEVGI